MSAGTAGGRRNPKELGVHTSLFQHQACSSSGEYY
jgi:hypothetical protein